MRLQTYNDIVTPELLEGCIDNNGHPGFLEDYRIIHCLIRKYKPQTFFEIGTCDGSGAKIIKNALRDWSALYSLDLPTELIHQSLRTGTGDRVGRNCDLLFTQLRGDSMTFDFSKYPCEGYFVDGNHTEESVCHETIEVLKNQPLIVIFHDSDLAEVMRGIVDGWGHSDEGDSYDLFFVEGTRIAYLLKVR
jgi:hypothetical protein